VRCCCTAIADLAENQLSVFQQRVFQLLSGFVDLAGFGRLHQSLRRADPLVIVLLPLTEGENELRGIVQRVQDRATLDRKLGAEWVLPKENSEGRVGMAVLGFQDRPKMCPHSTSSRIVQG
jgi:hypothetical protein